MIVTRIADALMIVMVVGIPCYAYLRGVKPMDAFALGARKSLDLVVHVLPMLVGMMVAIGMLRASGAFDLLAHGLAGLLRHVGVDARLLPMMFARPFSTAAANAALLDVVHAAGPDSRVAYTGAAMLGSTETTFYVLAVYFGAVSVQRTRYAVPVGLLADVSGMLAAVVATRWLLG